MMKRSTHVTLVLMGAVGIGASAYALQSYNCPRQAPAPGAVAGNTAQSCQPSSRGTSGSGYGRSFFSDFGSSGSSSTSTTSSPSSGAANRGGFGAIGRAFASFGS